MKSQIEEPKTNEMKKPRFKIEKLEERIAPRRGSGMHRHGNGGSGGHCGHGACK